MPEVGGISGDRLKSYIERIERLEEEKKSIAPDVREVYAEAKANGFDTKIMRQVLRLRAMDRSEREEREHLLELYKRALGLDTPLLEGADDGAAAAKAQAAAKPAKARGNGKAKGRVDGNARTRAPAEAGA